MTELEEQAMGELVSIGEKLDVLTARSEETLTVLGNMQGFMTFAIVVLLCLLVYKFFRMFF